MLQCIKNQLGKKKEFVKIVSSLGDTFLHLTGLHIWDFDLISS